MQRRAIVCAGAAFALAGCATPFEKPTAGWDQIAPPQNIEQAVKLYFEEVLRDPESARYRFGKPIKGFRNNGLIYGGKVVWQGYLVDVQVNARNGFGGYTGFKAFTVYFVGEKVVRHEEGADTILTTRIPD